MVFNETNLSLWPCLHSMDSIPWSLRCILSQLGGSIILFISVVCFTFNMRFLLSQRCQNSLVASLFVASLMVITISVPSVLVQLFTCHRHCSISFCRIEGFSSYLAGCLCMLIFTALSIHRYASLCSVCRLLSYKCSTFICWFLSILFTAPLIFGYFNSYLPEGLGFHCSINWQDQSNISRLYIFLSFILMYFLPLIILLYVNTRSHLFLRNIYSKNFSSPSIYQKYYHKSSKKSNRPTNFLEEIWDIKYFIRKAIDRKRFRIDYRFLRAIVFLISSYLIAWTPYSIIAILQLLHVKFIFQHAFLITFSAFLAKTSVILSPFVYLSIMHYKLFKRILLQ
jgi:hypothetical protein